MSGSITIKAGAGYDAPWLVVEAPEGILADQQAAHQRAYILAVFGMSADDPDIKDLSLAEVVAQAGYHFQGVWSKAGGNRGRGGRRGGSANLGDEKAADATQAETPEAGQGEERVLAEAVAAATEGVGAEVISEDDSKPETKAEADAIVEATKPAEHPHQDVLDEIAGASSKKELQAIFHGSKEAMANADVLAALQAKSKAVA